MKIGSFNTYSTNIIKLHNSHSFKGNSKKVEPKFDEFQKNTTTLSEKEKMLAGKMHIPIGAELEKERAFAQDMCFKYNNLHPSEKEKRKDIIRKLFAKTGEYFKIQPHFQCDYGYNIEFGERFFSNYNLVILDSAKVKFGDDVMIGPNCGFYTVNHPLDARQRVTGIQSAKPITVGNRVWIGGGVTVVGGVNIGDNVVVGAGSVVTKDLPPNTLCVGVPCKPIKQI